MTDTREIPLTQGLVALVDEVDFARVSHHDWCISHGYAVSRLGKSITPRPLARFILRLTPDDPLEVDHKNGDPLDNRRNNLRICNRSLNNANKGKQINNTSGYKGVTWHAGKWKAQIKINRKNKYLGRFANKEDAAKAYDSAAREAFGEFARTNF